MDVCTAAHEGNAELLPQARSRTRANACRASGLTVSHLLGHASTPILTIHVKPLDENTKAVIEALDLARVYDATLARTAWEYSSACRPQRRNLVSC